MEITRSTKTREVVRTETVPDGFDLHLSDDEALVVRFILVSAYLQRERFTSEVTGVRAFVDKAHEIEQRLNGALEKAHVSIQLSPIVLEPRG